MTARKKHAKKTKAKAKAKRAPAKKTAKGSPVVQGRPRRDARGNTHRYSIHLVPVQMDKLRWVAQKRGFANVSRMLAATADDPKNK